MRMRNYFEKIMKELKDYKSFVDTLIPEYQAELSKHEAYLQSMEGKYTAEYIAETRAKWRPAKNYSGVMKSARDSHKATVDFYINLMKKQLDHYFNAPVKLEFSNKVTAIKLMGLQLSDSEFKLLQDSATSYIERRLLAQLAADRTRKEDTTVLNRDKLQGSAVVDSALERKQIDVNNPYSGVSVPDIEQIYRAFNGMKSNVNIALQWYCGEDMQFKEFVGCTSDNYGSIANVAHAPQCFDIDSNRSYKEFLELTDAANEILPESKVKKELTEADKKFIDAIISPDDFEKYPSIEKKKAVEIAKTSPEVAALLMLDERFSKDVEEALAE